MNKNQFLSHVSRSIDQHPMNRGGKLVMNAVSRLFIAKQIRRKNQEAELMDLVAKAIVISDSKQHRI